MRLLAICLGPAMRLASRALAHGAAKTVPAANARPYPLTNTHVIRIPSEALGRDYDCVVTLPFGCADNAPIQPCEAVGCCEPPETPAECGVFVWCEGLLSTIAKVRGRKAQYQGRQLRGFVPQGPGRVAVCPGPA